MNSKWFAVLLILVATSAIAQTKEPSADTQLKILKIQKRFGPLNAKQQDISQKYNALLQKFNQTPEVQELQKESDANQAQVKALQEELKSAREQAYKDAGLDSKQYDFDDETLQFTPKNARASTAPSPAAK